MLHDLNVSAHELLACPGKAVKGTGLDKVLNRLLVDILVSHSGNKILQVRIWTSCLPLLYHRINDRSAHALNGGKRIADGLAVHRETAFSLIDIGRQNVNAHTAAHHNIFCHLSGIINHGCH